MKYHSQRLLSLALSSLIPLPAVADPVADIERAYSASVELAEAPIAEFEDRYVEELQKLKQKIQAQGNLEGVLAIQKEIENFKTLSDPDYSAYPGLERLRSIYEQTALELLADVTKKHLSSLDGAVEKLAELKSELTKSGDIENALRAEELRNSLLERRGSVAGTGDGTTLASDPLNLLWTLRSKADFELVKNCEAKHEGDAWILTSPEKAMSYLETDEEFKPPFSAKIRAATDTIEVRFFWAGKQIVIFNWESNPQQLRLQNPVTGRATGINGKGYIQPGDRHDLEIRVTAGKLEAFADGELRGEMAGEWGNLEGSFGIGPAFGSEITLEKFEVYLLDAESA